MRLDVVRIVAILLFVQCTALTTRSHTTHPPSLNAECTANSLFEIAPLTLHPPPPLPAGPFMPTDNVRNFYRSCTVVNETSPPAPCCNATNVLRYAQFANDYDTTRMQWADFVQHLYPEQLHTVMTGLSIRRTHIPADQLNALNVIIDSLKLIAVEIAPCGDALMGYLQGMFCLSCQQNSTRYQRESAVEIGVTLSDRVCSAVFNACEPLIDASIVGVQAIIDVLDVYTAAYTSADSMQRRCIDILTESIATLIRTWPNTEAERVKFCFLEIVGVAYKIGVLPGYFQQFQCRGWKIIQALQNQTFDESCKIINSSVAEPESCLYDDGEWYYQQPGFAMTQFVTDGDPRGFDAYQVGCAINGLSKFACGRTPPPLPPLDELRLIFVFTVIVGVVVLIVAMTLIISCRRQVMPAETSAIPVRRKHDETILETSLNSTQTAAASTAAALQQTHRDTASLMSGYGFPQALTDHFDELYDTPYRLYEYDEDVD